MEFKLSCNVEGCTDPILSCSLSSTRCLSVLWLPECHHQGSEAC